MTIKNNVVVLSKEEAARNQLTGYRKADFELALQSAGYVLVIEDK